MDAMLLLEGEALINVYKEFVRVNEEAGDGLALLEFVKTFLENVDTGINKQTVVRMLVDLFEQIDLNGDHNMEWSEFTAYCIDSGMAATVSRIARPTFYFMYDTRFQDPITRSPEMLQIAYHPVLDAIVTIERDSNVLRFLNSKCQLLRTLDATTSIRKSLRDIDKSVPLRHALMPPFRMIAVLMSNLQIPLWIITARSSVYNGTLHRVDAETSPCMLHFDDVTQLLLVGCTNGTIIGYNPELRKSVLHVRQHSDVMMSMASAVARGSLASSSLDGRVLLWDLGRRKVVRRLEGSDGAIEKLLVVGHLDLLLGLSVRNVVIGWDLGIAEITMTLGGHLARIKDITIVPTHPPRLVTMDEGCVFKLWEIAAPRGGTCPCLSSFRVDRLAGHFPAHCVMTVPQRLREVRTEQWMAEQSYTAAGLGATAAAAAAAPASSSDGDNDGDPPGASTVGDLVVAAPRLHRITTFPLEAPEPPCAALYNAPMACFISVLARDVAQWSAETGAGEALFASPDVEATCACFDDRRRKLYLGRTDGSVVAVNLQNGSPMKQGTAQHESVVALIYSDADRCLIAAAADGSLCVYDDEPQAALDDLRLVRHAHPAPITALAFSHELSVVVTGDREGGLRCWDFQDLKLVADLEVPAAVTALAAMGPVPLFLSADSAGGLALWSIRGHVHPFQLLCRFRNDHEEPEVFDPRFEAQQETQVQAQQQAQQQALALAGGASVWDQRASGGGHPASTSPPPVPRLGGGEGGGGGRRGSAGCIVPSLQLQAAVAELVASGGGAGTGVGPLGLAGRFNSSRVLLTGSRGGGAGPPPTAAAAAHAAFKAFAISERAAADAAAGVHAAPPGGSAAAAAAAAATLAALRTAAGTDVIDVKLRSLMRRDDAARDRFGSAGAIARRRASMQAEEADAPSLEVAEAAAALVRRVRISALVEQIVEDYAANHPTAVVAAAVGPVNRDRDRGAPADVADAAPRARPRRYTLDRLGLADATDPGGETVAGVLLPAASSTLPPAVRAWRQRLRVRMRTVPVAVTAMCVIAPAHEDVAAQAAAEARGEELAADGRAPPLAGGIDAYTSRTRSNDTIMRPLKQIFVLAKKDGVGGNGGGGNNGDGGAAATSDGGGGEAGKTAGAAAATAAPAESAPRPPLPDTEALLLTCDDRGRMTLVRLTQLLRRCGGAVPPRRRWPSQHNSYASRRRSHRDEAGPVITDETFFYGDVDAAAAAAVAGGRRGVAGGGSAMTAAEANLMLELEASLAATAAGVPSPPRIVTPAAHSPAATGGPAAFRRRRDYDAALRASSDAHWGMKDPSLDSAAASLTLQPGQSPSSGTLERFAGGRSPRQKDEEDEGRGGEGGASVVFRPSLTASMSSRKQQQQQQQQQQAAPSGMTVHLSGYAGVGIASTMARRSAAARLTMKRAALISGVRDVASPAAEAAFARHVRRGSLAMQQALLASIGGDADGAAGGSVGVTGALKRRARATPRCTSTAHELQPAPGDTEVLSFWLAHPPGAAICALHAFRIERMRGGGGAGDDAPAAAAAAAAAAPSRHHRRAALPELRGYYATTCGADGRMLVWSLSDGALLGELGNTAQDEDAIAAGAAERVRWRLPVQDEALAAERGQEARALMANAATLQAAVAAAAASGSASDTTKKTANERTQQLGMVSGGDDSASVFMTRQGNLDTPPERHNVSRENSTPLADAPARTDSAAAATAAVLFAESDVGSVQTAATALSATDAVETQRRHFVSLALAQSRPQAQAEAEDHHDAGSSSDSDDGGGMIEPDKLQIGAAADAAMMKHLAAADDAGNALQLAHGGGGGSPDSRLHEKRRAATVSAYNPSRSVLTPASVAHVLDGLAPAALAAATLGGPAVAVLTMSGYEATGSIAAAKAIAALAPRLSRRHRAALASAIGEANDALQSSSDEEGGNARGGGGGPATGVAASARRGGASAHGSSAARSKPKPPAGLDGFNGGPVCGPTVALTAATALRLAEAARAAALEAPPSALSRIETQYPRLQHESALRTQASVFAQREEEAAAAATATAAAAAGLPATAVAASSITMLSPRKQTLPPLSSSSSPRAGAGNGDFGAPQHHERIAGKSAPPPKLLPRLLQQGRAGSSRADNGGSASASSGLKLTPETRARSAQLDALIFAAESTAAGPARGSKAAIASATTDGSRVSIADLAEGVAGRRTRAPNGLSGAAAAGGAAPGGAAGGIPAAASAAADAAAHGGGHAPEDRAAAMSSLLSHLAASMKAAGPVAGGKGGKRRGVIAELDPGHHIPEPGPGVYMPTMFGPYSALEVIKARDIFRECCAGGAGARGGDGAERLAAAAGQASVEALRAHPFWGRMLQPARASAVLQALRARVEKVLTLRELMALVFPIASGTVLGKMIRWTDPAAAASGAPAQQVEWAKALTPETIEELDAVFATMDTDGSGVVTFAEIRGALASIMGLGSASGARDTNWRLEDIEQIVGAYDPSKSKELDRNGFMQLMAEAAVLTQKVEIR